MRSSQQQVIEAIDDAYASVSCAQVRLLTSIAEVDDADAWLESGARDLAHWLAMRYGISEWKARRWIAAAHALRDLTRTAEALEHGRLGIDKVVELARFATVETEGALIAWAQRVSCA